MSAYRIHFGDPCYLCGRPMVPGSRMWTAEMKPPGMVVHGARGLCNGCKHRTASHPELLPADDEPKAVA